MADKQKCGTISYRGETYIVWLEPGIRLVWVSKPNDAIYEEGNYGDAKANTPEKSS
jgi:hypothetical protein